MKITSFSSRLYKQAPCSKGSIRYPTLLYVIALWLSVLTGVARADAGSVPARSVLIIGDSLSSAYGLAIKDGWVARLDYRLEGTRHNFDIINASVSGDTTANGLSRLPALLDQHSPDVVIIELGGNDGLRGLSIKKLTENLTLMTDMAMDAKADVIILGMKIPSNYGAAYTRLFSSSFEKVATDTDARLVPFFLEGLQSSTDWFQADGIHPNKAAQDVMLDNVWTVLEPLLDTLTSK